MTVARMRVDHLVRQAAGRHPHRPALDGPDGTLDFAELERRAGRLAEDLRAVGAGAGSMVAVRMPRSVEHVVAILACWQAGGTCVPIDPALPKRRVDTMLRISRACLVVGDGSGIEAVGDPGEAGDPALAYIFFTSGSSAEPKAVAVPHSGILNEARWTAGAFGLTERDRGSWLSSPGFAISRWELWSSLAAGACVTIAGEGVEWSAVSTRDWLVRARISWSIVITSLGEQLFDLDWPEDGALRLLVTGGEQLRKWPSGLPFDVVNSYGVTETSGVRSVAWLPRTPPAEGLPPIGKAIANTRLYVLGEELTPVPSGATGELYIGGLGLAHGYLGQPELTAARFPPDPFGPAGSRMYRSGDLARVNVDGDIEFLGRRDSVAKIDGVRVDMAEVESVLLTHPAVSATAVTLRPRPDPNGGQRLVAYVVWRPGAASPANELRSFLAERLPRALVPTVFVAAKALPTLVPSGKVDRARLPEPGPGNLITDESSDPADEVERQVQFAVQTGLDTGHPVGGHDDFFALGGDSLRMARVQALLEKHLGVALPMGVLFESRTPVRIAAAVRAHVAGTVRPAAGPRRWLPEDTGGGPLVLPVSAGQRGMLFVEEMFPSSTQYLEVLTLRMAGAPDVPRLRAALGELVARHAALRTAIVDVPEYTQVVHPNVPWQLEIVDRPATSDRDLLADLDASGLLAPMDLSVAPLFRLRLYREPGEALLALVIHHLVWDGASAEVLLRDLAASYDGSSTTDIVGQVPVEEGGEGDLAYWINALDGAPRVLWADPPAVTRSVGRVGVVERQVPAEHVSTLRSLAAALGATPFMIGLSCFALALRRYHTSDEVVFSTPVSIRPEQAADQIGLHVNMLPVRLTLSPCLTGRDLVDSVRGTWLDAWHHRLVPFDRIVAETSHGRCGPATPPYSQVIFGYNRFPEPVVTADGTRWQLDHLPSRESRSDLMASWNDKPIGWTVRVEHATARMDARVAEDLADGMLAVLAALAENPDAELATLPGYPVRGAPAVPTRLITPAHSSRGGDPMRTNGSAPGNDLTDRVAGMWCAVLGVSAVDAGANFFELGGNSMTAKRLVTMMRSALGFRVPVRAIFDTDSFAEFMSLLRREHLGRPTNEG